MTKDEFIKKYGIDAYNKKNMQRRNWYKTHKEYEKSNAHNWQINNKEQYDIKQQEWRNSHKDEKQEYNQAYYKNNKIKYLLKYCKELEYVTNYELAKEDNFENWELHHILENYWSMPDLKKKKLYYNVNPIALIFIRADEHNKDKGISGKYPESSKWHKRYYSNLKKIN